MGILSISALGDALGAPYEFNQYILKRNETPKFTNFGGKAANYVAGSWTDDTSMALCIIASVFNRIAKNTVLTEDCYDQVAAYFAQWLEEDGAGVGIQTFEIISLNIDNPTANNFRKTANKIVKVNPDRCAGNGSLMRIHPVALLPLSREDAAEFSAEVTKLTHPDPHCVESSILWIEMLRVARETGNFEPYAGLDLIPVDKQPLWMEIIDDALTYHSSKFGRKPWWVVPSFQQAIAAVNNNYEFLLTDPMAIFTEIIAEPGSDSDTVCAIAGGLMGALGVTLEHFTDIDVNMVHGYWPKRLTIYDLEQIENDLENM